MAALVSDTPQQEHYNAEVKSAAEMNFMPTTKSDLEREIKHEPAIDINDEMLERVEQMPLVNGYVTQSANGSSSSSNAAKSKNKSKKPLITLTPTMKLLASPNPADPKRKFPCPYDNCTKSYGKSSHLRSHLTWHTGIKPYVCQEPNCGKGFTRSDELNRHLRTHTGEKPFECMQCAKKFSRSDHLTKHVSTHTKQLQNTQQQHAPKRTTRASMQLAAAQQLASVATGTDTAINNKSLSPGPEKLMPNYELAAAAAAAEATALSDPVMGDYSDGMHFMASLLECAQFKHGRHVLETEETEDLTDATQLPVCIKTEQLDQEEERNVAECIVASDKMKVEATIKSEEEASNAAMLSPFQESHHEVQSPTTSMLNALTMMNSTTTTAAASASAAHDYRNNNNAAAEPSLYDSNAYLNDDCIMPEANAAPLPPTEVSAAATAVAAASMLASGCGYFTGKVDGERPYHCSKCVRSFKRQDDLNRHLRTHTGERPYTCTLCEKRFNRSDHLKKHLKTHSKQQQQQR